MNILVFNRGGFAERQYNAHARRVAAAGGIIQDGDAITRRYELYGKLGISPRRHYSALGGVLLNNDAGTLKVQTWFDLNNTSPVDATQVATANQPTWSLDADTGFNVPLFDGNKVLTVDDLGILNGQQAGTIFTLAKDTNRTAGDSAHVAVQIRPNTESGARLSILTRATTNVFSTQGKVLDAASTSAVSQASADGYHALASIAVYVANSLVNYVDGVTASTTMGGAGTTSATNSSSITIGSNLLFTAKLPGSVAEVIMDRTALSVVNLDAFRTFLRRYYPTLP